MSRSTAVVLLWTGAGASVGLFALLTFHLWRGVVATVIVLDQAGWSDLVRRPATRPTEWLLGCVIAPLCLKALATVWIAHAPRWEAVTWVSTVYATAVFRLITARTRHRSALPPGAARWAHYRELGAFLRGERSSPQRGYLGVLAPSRRFPSWSEPRILRLPERLRCSHCLVVGGSGARKTTGYHKPNVLLDATDGVSVVIFDLKYPDPKSGFWDCVPYFATRRFDVQLFLPFDRQTLALPLLGEVRSLEDAYDIVDLLLPPPLQEHAANFYRDQERQLLVGLLLGVARDGVRRPDDPFAGPPSLRRLFRLCLGGIGEIERYIHTHPDAQVRDAVSGLFDLETRLLAGIAAGVAGRLQLFNDDRLERATSPPSDPRCVVRLEHLGTVPTLLYIGIPQEKVQGARGQLVLQLVKRTIERALLQTADRAGGALPQHVSVYLDEFAAMGPLPNVSEMMATMRSRRVAYHLSLQNRAHGELLYGATGFRSFFVNNIQTVIIFPRFLKFDDAQYFSEMLGYMTVEQRATGLTHRGLLGGSRTDWARDALRPLVPPEEYPDWPEPMGILFTIGARPVRVLLPRLDEDRAAGVRNPLRGFRPYLSPGGDVATREQLIMRLIHHHAAWMDAHYAVASGDTHRNDLAQARGLIAPFPRSSVDSTLLSEVTQPLLDRSSPPLPTPPPTQLADTAHAAQPIEMPEPQLVASLCHWVHDVVQRELPPTAVRAYYHNGRLTRLGVYRIALPEDLSLPPHLGAWMTQRWVRVSPSEIGLLPRAWHVLPKELVTTLRRAGSRHVRGRSPTEVQLLATPPRYAPPGPIHHEPLEGSTSPEPEEKGSHPSTLAVEALSHLRAWVNEHGAQLDGHPQRDPQADLRGLYRVGQAVVVPAETVKEVLASAGILPEQMPLIRPAWRDAGWIRVDPHHLTTVRRLGGKRRRVVEVLWHAWTGTRRVPEDAPDP